MLKLYDYFRSSASFRVRIALNLKQLAYECVPVHLINNGGEQHAELYKAINPQQLVPALADGNKVITQSLAIIEYLDETHPEPALLPKDAYTKSLIRSFALAIVADLHPLNNLRVLNYLKQDLHLSDDDKSKWFHHWINTTFTALETRLSTSSLTGKYSFGDSPTLADVCLVPQMYNARRFKCDLSAYPILVRIDEHCQKLDAVKKAWPDEAIA